MPLLGPAYLKKQIQNKYDYLIVLKVPCRMAVFSKVATRNIYWNHSSHEVKYAKSENLSFSFRINRIRLSSIYKHFDEIWFVNEIILEKCRKAFSLRNCLCLPNPINIGRILSLAQSIPQDYHNTSSKLTIMMVGRLSPEKGFDRVLKAMGSISTDEDYQIVIIGDGPEKARLQTIAFDNGIGARVFFLGSKNNPYQYMKYADLLVSPSREESFGLVVLEAMVLKIPVLATKTIGTEYVTDFGNYGILVENDDGCLQSALKQYIENPHSIPSRIEESYKWASCFGLPVFLNTMLTDTILNKQNNANGN